MCFSRMANYYVAPNAYHFPGPRSMTMGDVVLKPGLAMPRESLKALIQHEAAHRTQWAVGTVIGGPAAFPIAYGVTYFFFPGARNPFERLAGLESGGYTPSGTGPVLGPAQLAVLSVLGAVIVSAPLSCVVGVPRLDPAANADIALVVRRSGVPAGRVEHPRRDRTRGYVEGDSRARSGKSHPFSLGGEGVTSTVRCLVTGCPLWEL